MRKKSDNSCRIVQELPRLVENKKYYLKKIFF